LYQLVINIVIMKKIRTKIVKSVLKMTKRRRD
jgi:hypothetical protein